MDNSSKQTQSRTSGLQIALYIAFFLSGFTALVYQVIWIRAFSDIIGSTSQATACIFSAFLLSLSFGSYIVSFLKYSPKVNLRIYALLEAFTGIFALLITPWLMHDSSFLTQLLIDFKGSGMLVNIGVNFLITFVVIVLPVMAMGGTFPLMAAGLPETKGEREYTLFLYGLNTIGAATGAALTGFFLVKNFGYYNTLLISMSFDLIAALIALFISFKGPQKDSPIKSISEKPADKEVSTFEIGSFRQIYIDALAFMSGFIVLAYEIYWERAAKFFVGNRVQASSLLLFAILAGLGSASVWVKTDRNRFPLKRSIASLAKILWVNALIQPVIFALVFALIKLNMSDKFPYPLLFLTGLTAMLFSLIILGTLFPYLLASLKDLKSQTVKSLGRALFFNTLGCSLGSLWAGFIGARYLGTPLSIALLASTLLLVSFLCNRLAKFFAAKAYVSAIIVLLAYLLQSGYMLPFVFPPDARVLYKNEDEYGFHSIFKSDKKLWARTNKSYLVAPAGPLRTAWAQETAAHWPMLYAKQAKDVLVIGNGYGITAGAFRVYTEPEKIQAIEIMPYMVNELTMFSDYNFAYHEDPRFETLLTDGKSFVELATQSWDIINLNISDPALEGSAQFYTLSSMKMLKEHLNPGGVFTVLVWGNALDSIIKTMLQVYPEFLLFPVYANSYVAVCPKEPYPGWETDFKFKRLSKAARKNFQKFELKDPEKYLKDVVPIARKYYKERKDAAQKSGTPVHTVDKPVIEYILGSGEFIYTFNSSMINP
ncbi:MAG: hypothetical protein ACQETH_03595 [Candidatus Rifleibacteriota bacterium]